MRSIWHDIEVNLGTADAMVYNVYLGAGGDTIYTGKAYRKPGQANIIVRINDIVAAAWEALAFRPQAEFDALTFPITFEVDDDEGNIYFSDKIIPDWSYDHDHSPMDAMSDPIDFRVSPLQYFVRSVADGGQVDIEIYDTFGDPVQSEALPIVQDAASFPFGDDYLRRRLNMAGAGTAFYDLTLSDAEVGGRIYADTMHTYEIVDCAEFCLYYINAYGGWDSLLVHGNPVRTDNLTRHTIGVDYSNANPVGRGIINYLNEIVRSLRMRTGWLTDDQSLRMHHLLNSTCVYLHDLTHGWVVPVVLKNTATDYKTFKNQGGRLVSYEMSADIAHSMMRQ